MKNLKYFLALVIFCGCLFSCTKEETETGETAENSVQSSAICGTWKWQFNLLQEDEYLRIIFSEHSYRVESRYLYCYGDTCIQHNCHFYNQEQGNYKIEDGKFYRWHVTPLPNFAEIPYQEGLAPTFNVTLNGDTLELKYLHSVYQGPNTFPIKYKLVKMQ